MLGLHDFSVAPLNLPSNVARTSFSRQHTNYNTICICMGCLGCDGGMTKHTICNIQATHRPHAYANSVVVCMRNPKYSSFVGQKRKKCTESACRLLEEFLATCDSKLSGATVMLRHYHGNVVDHSLLI